MNELLSFICGFLLLSSVEGSNSQSLENIQNPISTIEFDKVNIDFIKSKILWKGTKMMGLGKHEGGISIKKGFLIFQNKQLTGGEITVNMESITVTDIPSTDPIPIRNLTNHLKSTDFFDVDKHPFSTFRIIQVKKHENGELLITGELEIKGITNTISFTSMEYRERLLATIEIDRFDWDIAYSGSWVDRTFVDREIQLRIELVCN